MRHGRGALSQAIQAAIIEVARIFQRFRQASGDLAKIETFEEIHLQRSPLLLTQLFKSRVQLLARQQIGDLLFVAGLYLQSILDMSEFCTIVEFSSEKVGASIKGAPVSDLNDPRPARAFARVETSDLLAEAQENLLDQVLRFSSVAERSEADSKNKRRIAIEQHAQGSAVAVLGLKH